MKIVMIVQLTYPITFGERLSTLKYIVSYSIAANRIPVTGV